MPLDDTYSFDYEIENRVNKVLKLTMPINADKMPTNDLSAQQSLINERERGPSNDHRLQTRRPTPPHPRVNRNLGGDEAQRADLL